MKQPPLIQFTATEATFDSRLNVPESLLHRARITQIVRNCLFYAVAFGFLQNHASRAAPTIDIEFEARGTVNITEFGKQQVNRPPISFRFSRRGPLWFLHTTRNKGASYQEVSFDGNQLYYLSIPTTPPPNPSLNVATGWVFRETEILHSLFIPEAAPLWLAFASDRFFQSQSRPYLEPVITFGIAGGMYDFDSSFKQRAAWELSEAAPRIPIHVTYFDDGIIRSKRGSTGRQPPPYHEGFTNVIFAVQTFTNVGNLRIPASASLKIFRPKQDGKTSTDLHLLSQFEIAVDDVKSESSVKLFQPQLPGKTQMSDIRFMSKLGPLGYKSDSWLSQQEAMALPEFKRALARAATHSDHALRASPVRLLTIIVLLVLISMPVFFLRQINLKKQKDTL